MSKEQLTKQYDKMIAEAGKLKETIDSMEVDNKKFRVEEGDTYYTVDSSGDVDYEYERFDSTDDFSFKSGNYFETLDEAEERKERMLAEQELLDMCDWKEGTMFFISYYIDKSFVVKSEYHNRVSKYIFEQESGAKEAIKSLGDRKLKLIFGIKD